MATQFSDMALGGESGFAAGYTPIRFAPLVSLTGPIEGPATPTAAAPAAPQAPMLKLPQESGYEVLGNPLFEGDPIGTRMSTPAGRQAELANLANAAGFLASPFTAMANYVLTGQSPAQFFDVGDWRTAQGVRSGEEPRGMMPAGGIQGLLTGARNLLFGPQQPSVALGDMRAPAGAPNLGMNIAVMNDAYQLALSNGADDLAATNAASAAASLVAQGVDPITAATISAQYAVGAAGPQLPEMPGLSTNAYALPSGPQTMAQSMPGLAAMNQTLAQFAQGGPAAVADSGSYGGQSFSGGVSGVTEGFGSPGSVADVSGGQAPY